METALDIARQLGQITEKLDLNALWQREKAKHIAAMQRELENLIHQQQELWQEWEVIADRFRHEQYEPEPRAVPADLTGNSLKRVFEDHPGLKEFDGQWTDADRAQMVAEQAKPMDNSDDSIAYLVAHHARMSNDQLRGKTAAFDNGIEPTPSHMVPKAFRKERNQDARAESEPVADQGVGYPFRHVSDDDVKRLMDGQPVMAISALVNQVLGARAAESDRWFMQKTTKFSRADKEHTLRPIDDGELSYLMDMYMKSVGADYRRMRDAVDSLLAKRRGE